MVWYKKNFVTIEGLVTLKFRKKNIFSSVPTPAINNDWSLKYVFISGLERLLRDGRAGWVMGMSNEMLRQIVGKSALDGLQSIDLW